MRLGAGALLAISVAMGVACNERAVQKQPDAATIVGGLSPEQAAKPVAKYGNNKVITLGEFAQALADMPEYERMRYQGVERRKELLRAMIDMHLLAEEAKKQGLDKDPVVGEEIRQVLVAWMRGKLIADLPQAGQLPEPELRAFYDSHIAEYREPERRRVAQIVTKDEATAKKAWEEAKAANPTQWGGVVKKYSEEKPGATEAPEMSGDLGFATAPSDTHPQPNPKLTPEVRTAAFALPSVGAVSPPFKDGNGWHVVRLIAKNEARDQSFADVERIIRVRVLQEKRAAKEKALLEETRKTVKVEVDEATLQAVAAELAAPAPAPSPSPSTSVSALPQPSASVAASSSVTPSASASVKKP